MTTTRINRCFERCRAEKRGALVVFASVGCPTLKESEELIDRLIDAGADMIELGVPFSDPMADGVTIQKSGQIALSAGTTLPEIIEIAKRIRQAHPETPLILFSYYNVLLNYGLERLGSDLKAAGVDGVLVIDLPLEEREEIMPMCEVNDISFIPLISPATSTERAKQIAENCNGFVYCITVRGVTGVRNTLPPELSAELEAAKTACQLPVAAGFGISTPEMARSVAKHADAVVVGSAVMKSLIEEGSNAAVTLVAKLAKGMR
ncbi:MAG: tryptophan synthase subunit alpha [Victivallales bacterium]|nr:tryptophan synthase subunit alpha [Victivallales bacterium]